MIVYILFALALIANALQTIVNLWLWKKVNSLRNSNKALADWLEKRPVKTIIYGKTES